MQIILGGLAAVTLSASVTALAGYLPMTLGG